jgi:hypothetical protein
MRVKTIPYLKQNTDRRRFLKKSVVATVVAPLRASFEEFNAVGDGEERRKKKGVHSYEQH